MHVVKNYDKKNPDRSRENFFLADNFRSVFSVKIIPELIARNAHALLVEIFVVFSAENFSSAVTNIIVAKFVNCSANKIIIF